MLFKCVCVPFVIRLKKDARLKSFYDKLGLLFIIRLAIIWNIHAPLKNQPIYLPYFRSRTAKFIALGTSNNQISIHSLCKL